MSKKRIEGYWDCEHCGTKGIGGLTKTCPNCGHPQAKGLKFYVKKESPKYLDAETSEKYGKGADWICAFCGSYNRYNDLTCRNCGAGKEDSEENYFGKATVEKTEEDSDEYATEESKEDDTSSKYLSEENEESIESPCRDQSNYQKGSPDPIRGKIDFKKIFSICGGIAIIVGLILLLINVFTPRNYNATITDKSWSKSITIEELRTFRESDWDIPYGARVYDERKEIRGYNKIVDHYEIEEYEVSHDEIDYYDVEYVDNGDGTFDEEKVPVYKTVYETKTREKPVYKDVPVYDIKYYYKIDRWCYERTERSTGKTDEPYWPEFTLNRKERESSRVESYTVNLETEKKTYLGGVSFEDWKKYEIGMNVDITVVAGIVTKIELIN